MPVVPKLVWIFAVTLAIIAPFALLAGRRGGRYRALPGWIGAWAQFAILIVVLSRLGRNISFPLLGLVMFVMLKQYFTLTPLRPQDRWAIMVAYLSIPLALWPTWSGSFGLLSAATVIGLFLLIPILLSIAPRQPGLLDALGRLLLGVLVFVFCAAHFGLMTQLHDGSLELFGITALLADLPQRLTGRIRPGGERGEPLVGLVASVAIAAAAGAMLAPHAGAASLHGGVAGALIALAMAGGSLVSDAVAQDLMRTQSDAILGRAAFLDRTLPVIYAAPIFYHYLRAVAS
jgi:predicted CDP-diglyceride synthetase/phosphatidate cytidylyltransferase